MFKLMLLMTMGLGALYLIHLLAQDYNKIRQPVSAITRAFAGSSIGMNLLREKRDVSLNTKSDYEITNVTNIINWQHILARDPFKCLQSFICQLNSGVVDLEQSEPQLLLQFFKSTFNLAPKEIVKAYKRGLTFRGRSFLCFEEYPFCIYSAKTMLKILTWFT